MLSSKQPGKSSRLWIVILLIPLAEGARQWDYEPISIETTSSDESKLKFDAKIERLGRGEFGLSGTIEWKYDADENTMVESSAYRSTTGQESDYKLLPWTIPKQRFHDYLKTYYKDVLLKNVGHCSNLPHFDGNFEPPWPKNTYTFTKCKMDGEGLPEVAPPGFYKIIFTHSGTDQPTWGFTIILKLTTKMI